MVANRRNFIFRVSIVINIAVMLYAAMHLSANTSPMVEWVPVTGDGSERNAELQYLKREITRNDTDRLIEPMIRDFEESTSQKSTSTMPTTNKTASSTVSATDLEKKISAAPPDVDINEMLDIVDENGLSDTTLTRLRSLLACTEKDFLPQTVQRGEFWVLKNYIRADHGTIMCHESITYTTHAGFEFLDNVLPLVER